MKGRRHGVEVTGGMKISKEGVIISGDIRRRKMARGK